jgi:hypothetical protein
MAEGTTHFHEMTIILRKPRDDVLGEFGFGDQILSILESVKIQVNEFEGRIGCSLLTK